MPPAAGIVARVLAVAGSVCLAAQTDLPAGPMGPLARADGSVVGGPSLDQQSRRLEAALQGSGSGGVRPVGFDSPIPSGDAAEPSQPERSRHAQGATSSKDEPGRRAISPPGHDAPVHLSPPGQSGRRGKARVARAGNPLSVVTVASSLGVVLGLFLVVAWAMRRTVPGAAVTLPSEVVEVLGRAALAGKAQVHLVRCGSKLLLVSLSPTGVETLTEITDPDEVGRVAGLCRQAQPGSTTAAFRQVFQQFAGQRAAPGPPGTDDDVRLANTGVARPLGGTLEGYDV